MSGKPHRDHATQQRFLVIQTAFIGDVILATPLARILKEHHPDAEVHYLVRKGNEKLLAENPNIDRIITWDKKHKKYRHLLATIRQVRTTRYTAVYNIQRFLSTGIITLLARSRKKIGFNKNPLSLFFHKRITHATSTSKQHEPLHEVDRNLALTGLDHRGKILPEIFISDEEKAHLASLNLRKPYLIFAPGAVWFTKQWPKEKWQELAETVPRQFTIYLVGSATDSALADEIINSKPHIISLCGQLSMNQTTELMRGALRVFTNDSAPLHMASAANAPTTAIFCSTLPAFGFYPLARGSRVAQTQSDLSCRPCGLHGKKSCPQKHFQCAYQISTRDVLPVAHLAEWLATTPLETQQKIAADFINHEKILLHETDTIPGLAALATSQKAIEKLFAIKKRASGHPMLILCDGIEMIRKYVENVPDIAIQITKRFPDIPITIIYPGFKNLPGLITGHDNSIAIRIPAIKKIRQWITQIGAPIVSTSANTSGHPPPAMIGNVEEAITRRVDLMMPQGFGNTAEQALSSNLIGIEGEKAFVVRPGYKAEEIDRWMAGGKAE